jgi:hypothetical protein
LQHPGNELSEFARRRPGSGEVQNNVGGRSRQAMMGDESIEISSIHHSSLLQLVVAPQAAP